MKNLTLRATMNNRDGFILVTSLVIMLVLILLGTFAFNMTVAELQIARNDRVAKEDFYNQESCIASGKFQFRTWLTTAYLIKSETTAFFPPAGNDTNGNGFNDLSECKDPNGIVRGAYKVRDIEITGTSIAGWDDAASFPNAADHPANKFPKMAHKDKPVPGSGTDPKNFEIRRYVMTSYSPENDRNIVLQQGVYKIFNKF